MSHDLYQYQAHSEQELRRARMLGEAQAGHSFIEHLRQLQLQVTPQKRRLDSTAFRGVMIRDLTSNNAAAGGALIGTHVNPVEVLLPRYSVFGESGVNVFAGLDSPVTIPRVNTVATAGWLANDGANISGNDPGFGQIALNPKFVAAKINFSRQLMLQSNAERVIGSQVLEAVFRAIDIAILAGTGAAGQPQGLVNTPGIGVQSGTALNAAGLRAMRRKVLDAGAREDRLQWIADPATQELLGGREFSAGSGRLLWDDGKVLGRPAIATSLAPANTLIVGDFGRVTVGVFDAMGFELEYNPFENFRAGQVAFRLILPVDFGMSPAGAFAVASGVN